ncbi:hypothetical protein CJ203_04805 [Corynebacterium tuscaniense]|uniref:MFS transporter n=1 Tax=Corynebacterium tuscaniense TaxID=302449 RepID=A0A2N6T5N8_9CORY|nr:hypothetical protein [Corynebacterium tuscaniense]KGF23126.1 hypothetical protein HMPREF2129_05395 [Corynebacterium tuscaniense DNF00037]PMC64622.1 hypothetical protein CJ203_04805 [Corynebacterium tuscaniense]
MKPHAILGTLLAGAIGIPVLTVLLNFLITDPEYWSVMDALVMAVGAMLATVWVGFLDSYLFVVSRREPVGTGVLVTALVGSAMLFIGFGSTALASWEEVQAGQALPIINLFIFLIPLGLIVVAIAFLIALTKKEQS